jgi:hypothetical protein
VNGERRVSLEGVWERRWTDREDAGLVRRRLAESGESRGVEDARFVMRREPFDNDGLRGGVFSCIVTVPYRYTYGNRTTERQFQHRAVEVLRWFLQDFTCRPPKLTVTSSEVLY